MVIKPREAFKLVVIYSTSQLGNENIEDSRLLTACDLSVHVTQPYNFKIVKMRKSPDTRHQTLRTLHPEA